MLLTTFHRQSYNSVKLGEKITMKVDLVRVWKEASEC